MRCFRLAVVTVVGVYLFAMVLPLLVSFPYPLQHGRGVHAFVWQPELDTLGGALLHTLQSSSHVLSSIPPVDGDDLVLPANRAAILDSNNVEWTVRQLSAVLWCPWYPSNH